MKLKYLAIGFFVSAVSSQAAVTINGAGPTTLFDHNGAALTDHSLGIWVADTGNDGFGALTQGSIAPGASLTVGSTFGGDLIVSRNDLRLQFGSTAGSAGWSYDNPAAVGGAIDLATGTKFAFIWFADSDASAATGVNFSSTQTTGGTYYGVASLTSGPGAWALTGDTSGGFGFTSTPANIGGTTPYFQVSVANGNATNTLGGNGALNNLTANFAIVPEPSAALLGMLGALGLLRRRR